MESQSRNYGLWCKRAYDLKKQGMTDDVMLKQILLEGYQPRKAIGIKPQTVSTMASSWAHDYFNEDGTPTQKFVDSRKANTENKERRKAQVAAPPGPRVWTAQDRNDAIGDLMTCGIGKNAKAFFMDLACKAEF